MRTVFVLFDSLNRTAMGCYGSEAVKTPNFDRFAARAQTFDNHYVGSLPCMPARRDLHTGRLNFTHRSWGPLEPYDKSFAQILKQNGTYTHLISDHFHYFEDGGSGFHTRFSSFDFIRGQEYDPWVAMVQPPIDRFKEIYSEKHYKMTPEDKHFQALVNREELQEEEQFPTAKCFASAFDFLDKNKVADDWMLMLECFDPHEPFHVPPRFREAYESGYNGKILDWPHYERVSESESEMREIRANYAALVAMCDEYFGKLLDYFDEHDMWKDTALILTTDHGFLLSEHEWWGKCRMPYYEEISHIPLIIHDPRFPEAGGRRTNALTQSIDVMPTIMGLHGIEPPAEVLASDLAAVMKDPNYQLREVAVFGIFGGPIGIADGTYATYYYPPDIFAEGLREYTLAPAHMTDFFTPKELRTAELSPGFNFTQGIPLLSIAAQSDAKRVPMNDGIGFDDIGTRLYNVVSDPKQKAPFVDEKISQFLMDGALKILQQHDTPAEVYGWYGLLK
ncbi:sulfatase [Pseudovibrio sp. Tun.PSC04-5.I4]|uniref:sulfatase n=1 Tax=Pseudovibrio sp. Tun.PSC04-5.I4 TaxID=1798213 RepID=UPI0008856DB0|nr:sulfatase [Pseudovibrio sp. Tun.PSC04-5.I4]SDQ74757.1 Arylsulfatase A [Pseudovibrio sp. Tun.PSC04-5.I4]